jgi:hypothetical protein
LAIDTVPMIWPFAAACLLLAILLPWIAIRTADFRKFHAAYLAAWLAALLAVVGMPPCPSAREGLLATLAVELPIAAAYLLWRKRPAVLLLTIVLGMNAITRPLVYFAVVALYPPYGNSFLWILACELAVCIAEAVILAIALRKESRFREALLLSLVLNGASFGIGLLLPF